MDRPPKKLNGADVLVWAPLDDSVAATSLCTDADGPVSALAVCVLAGPPRQYCLFHCDRRWRVLADTEHDTLELAQCEAEAEYRGVTPLWRAR
jgi:hypothetical protein